jgi:hypothetical protein
LNIVCIILRNTINHFITFDTDYTFPLSFFFDLEYTCQTSRDVQRKFPLGFAFVLLQIDLFKKFNLQHKSFGSYFLLIYTFEVANFIEISPNKITYWNGNSPTRRQPPFRHGLAIEYNTTREDGGKACRGPVEHQSISYKVIEISGA